jgi:hypothetical protein
MGQPITVVEKPSSNPAVMRFETNRPLSGMGHERYVAPPDPLLRRPVDELARRLFAHGGVTAVHINGAMVTVSLAPGSRGDGMADVVRSLFLHYGGPRGATEPTEATAETGTTGADTPQGVTETAAEPALVEDADTVAPPEGREAEAAAREQAAAETEAAPAGAGPATSGSTTPTGTDAPAAQAECGTATQPVVEDAP